MDEENLPSAEECQKHVEEFVLITGTNEALAQSFLQDREWNLERSVNSYFEASAAQEQNPNDSDIVVTFDSFASNLEGKVTTEPPSKFSILSWNLDGLDQNSLKKRTKAVAAVILKEKPDIVFLQEVIPASCSYLEERLPEYLLISGGDEDYFTATLLCQMTVYFDGHTIHSFSGSSMNRNLLFVECHIGSLNLRLLNSHLESTAEFSDERKRQLKQCFNLLKEGPKTHVTIFGGDLNIRDKEVAEVQIPANTHDLWEACGRRKECQYTWDMMRNSNKQFPGTFKPRLRFDRIYYRDTLPSPSLKPIHFGLAGIQKVVGTQSFPSDHWGIITYFKILNQSAKTISPLPSCTIKKSSEELSSPVASTSKKFKKDPETSCEDKSIIEIKPEDSFITLD